MGFACDRFLLCLCFVWMIVLSHLGQRKMIFKSAVIHSKIPSMLQLQNKTLGSLSKGSCAAASARIFFRKCIVNVMAHNWMVQMTYRILQMEGSVSWSINGFMDAFSLQYKSGKNARVRFWKKVLRPCIAGCSVIQCNNSQCDNESVFAHLCASISLLSGCIWSYWNHLDATLKHLAFFCHLEVGFPYPSH